MKRLRTLRTRLILAYAGLIVVGFGMLAVLAGGQISQAALHDYESSLETQAPLVANGLSDALAHLSEGESTQADVETLLNRYAAQTGARLTLIDTTGRAWLDSSGSLPSGSRSGDPEIVAALAGRVGDDFRPDEQGVTTLYVAAPIQGEEGLLGVIRLAVSVQAARDVIVQRWLGLGSGVLILTLLALIASLLLAASLTRPLDQLRRSALQLAAGDLAHRVPQNNRADEIGQLAEAFNYLADEVQAMLDEQRAFASNASHELRTPLTTIRLRSEALRAGTLDKATARRYIAEIDDEAARLGSLVEDLILLSRLDAGRASPGGDQVDPFRLARDLVRELTPVAGERRIALVLDAPGDLPPVQASPNHLRVVLRNLLDNAVKYTPEGGEVTLRMRAEGGALHAAVTDTGQGVAPEDLPHLFKRFYRADKARTRVVPGAGLGLSLVQSVVEFYGGQVEITSPGPWQGTTVSLRWPLARQDNDS